MRKHYDMPSVLVQLHNLRAELAAERERATKAERREDGQRALVDAEQRKRLTAEAELAALRRYLAASKCEDNYSLSRERDDARAELAAEQRGTDAYKTMLKQAEEDCEKLRAELAAERERVKALQEALDRLGCADATLGGGA